MHGKKKSDRKKGSRDDNHAPHRIAFVDEVHPIDEVRDNFEDEKPKIWIGKTSSRITDQSGITKHKNLGTGEELEVLPCFTGWAGGDSYHVEEE